MGANQIRYDRLWLTEYIERLKYQKGLSRFIEQCLQTGKNSALPEMQMSYRHVLFQVEEFSKSLEQMEIILGEYLENVQRAAFQLQDQCREIELPEFMTR